MSFERTDKSQILVLHREGIGCDVIEINMKLEHGIHEPIGFGVFDAVLPAERLNVFGGKKIINRVYAGGEVVLNLSVYAF